MHPFTKRMVRNAEALAAAREKDPSLNRSIHPRVVRSKGQAIGRTRYDKVNTCKVAS